MNMFKYFNFFFSLRNLRAYNKSLSTCKNNSNQGDLKTFR